MRYRECNQCFEIFLLDEVENCPTCLLPLKIREIRLHNHVDLEMILGFLLDKCGYRSRLSKLQRSFSYLWTTNELAAVVHRGISQNILKYLDNEIVLTEIGLQIAKRILRFAIIERQNKRR